MQIFVVGMHRSGTSAVARMLNMMGAYFGSEEVSMKVDQANPKGYWERKDVWLMNEKILKSTHSEWYSVNSFSLEKIPEEALQEFDVQAKNLITGLDTNRPWFVKDPRFCLTFPLWRKHLEFPVCVHVYRSPIQIAQSLRTRNQFSLYFGLALWEKYTLESLKSTLDCPNLLILHSELISQPVQTTAKLYQGLTDIGCRGLRLPHEKEILAFINPALHRERGSIEKQADFVNRQQSELIELLETGQALNLIDPSREVSLGSREIIEIEGNAVKKINELELCYDRAQKEITQLQHNHQTKYDAFTQEIKIQQQEIKIQQQEIKIQQQETTKLRAQIHDHYQSFRKIDSLTRKLRNDFNAVIQSWRWKIGDKIVRLIELFLLRLPVQTAVDTIEDKFKQIQKIIASIKTTNTTTRLQISSQKEHPFKTFEQYLACALTNPNILKAPLAEEDHRIVSVMEHYKKQLVNKYQNLPQNDLISILMPTYQRAREIPLAITSILQQSYKNWQLIIVDDGGTDNTKEIVKSFDDQRIQYIKLSNNKGNAFARNVALSNSRGDFICQLDSDDEWDENFLLIMLNEIKTHGATFGYSAQSVWTYPKNQNEGSKALKVIRFAPFNRSLLENNNYISQISVIFHRNLTDKSGIFDERMKRYVDWDFFLRLSTHAYPIAIPVILSHAYQNRADQHVSKIHDRDHYLTLLREKFFNKQQAMNTFLDVNDSIEDPEIEGLLKSCYVSTRIIPTPHNPPEVTIVIPSYESIDFLKLCISSIRKFTKNYHTIIVDNNSGTEVSTYLNSISHDPDITIILNNINYGFTYAVNQGIESANPNSDIVILNNDTLVTPGWLNAMQYVAQEIKDAGIVAPRQVLLAGTETIKTHVPYADPHWETDTNLSAHHANVIDPFLSPINGWIELDYAPFFCVYITRECIKVNGLLDHINGPHYRSDRTYCSVVRNYGKLRIVYTPDSKIYHFHQRATHELRKRNPTLFQIMKGENDWNKIRSTQNVG